MENIMTNGFSDLLEDEIMSVVGGEVGWTLHAGTDGFYVELSFSNSDAKGWLKKLDDKLRPPSAGGTIKVRP